MNQPGSFLLPVDGRTVAASYPSENLFVVETWEGDDRREAAGVPLPCLSSDNCTERREIARLRTLQPSHKKTADLLAKSVEEMCRKHGINHVLAITLTFAEHITDPREAQPRYHSLRTHVLKPRYGDVIRVVERQMSGRIHYHLLVATKEDVRTGVDFAALDRGDYRSANPALRAEWAFWRKTAPLYKFGRTEALPIKSNEEGISRYFGKYISKHIQIRKPEDKGIRLVEYTRGARVGNTKFSWVNPASRFFRAKLREWATCHGLERYEQISSVFGPRWAYHHREAIFASDWEMFVESAEVALKIEAFGALGKLPADWGPGIMSSRTVKSYTGTAQAESLRDFKTCMTTQLATTAPPGDPRMQAQREARQLVENLRREIVGGPTANAAKRSAEVPPKPPSAEEPPEAPNAPRNAPRKYSLAPGGTAEFLTLRPQHVEQRPLNFTRQKPTHKTQ